jgi:hypothetical protein
MEPNQLLTLTGLFTALGVFLGFAFGHKQRMDNPNINYDVEVGPFFLGFLGGLIFCAISLVVIASFPWGILGAVTTVIVYFLSKLFAKHLL